MDLNSEKPPKYNQINEASAQSQFVTSSLQPPPDASDFGSGKMKIACFHCGAQVTTRKEKYPNAMCCFCFGLWALCCPGCQDVEHRCPNCNAIQGIYRPV